MIDLDKFKTVWDKNRKMLIRRLCFSGLDLQLAEEICQDAEKINYKRCKIT